VSDTKGGQSKTEQPTPKRLRDLRKRGDVAKSPDVPATAVVVAGVIFFALGGGYMIDHLNDILVRSARADFKALENPAALLQWTRQVLFEAVVLVLPLILVLASASALAGVIQVGAVFSIEPIKPQLARLNPFAGAKRLFSLHTLVGLLKLIVKTLVLGAVIWLVTLHALPNLLRSHWLPADGILPFAARLFGILAWSAVGAFIAIAAFDLWFQSWDYRRRNRMSIEEVRFDQKEAEGDPHVRSRRRQLHREVSDATMLQNVRQASVVVVNPTHIAVALYYEAGKTDLPVVVAKGEGHLAREIRRIAEEEGVPVLHNIDLARRLQAEAPIDQYIPDELIEPVAAVLRWARSLNR
jgi:type III secretion protein U